MQRGAIVRICRAFDQGCRLPRLPAPLLCFPCCCVDGFNIFRAWAPACTPVSGEASQPRQVSSGQILQPLRQAHCSLYLFRGLETLKQLEQGDLSLLMHRFLKGMRPSSAE